ncbi:DUF6286 domain-containing protein [Kineococcus sp. SYSU DK006]|uniref:DUF6286 domain-containing protein n=1 Tax=Kineococcus sp. SYSU DK006 TaxID=3383127 RepID=UPI003D7CEB60
MNTAQEVRGSARAARRPTGAGRIGVVGPALAVLLLALAVLIGREAAVGWGALGGGSLLAPAVGALDGLTPSPALALGGLVALLAGVALVVTGLGRRRRDAIALAGAPGVFCTARDVARTASGAARRRDGVLEARSTAGRRTVAVHVRATSEAVRDDVQRAVEERLRVLTPTPRVRVKVEVAR